MLERAALPGCVVLFKGVEFVLLRCGGGGGFNPKYFLAHLLTPSARTAPPPPARQTHTHAHSLPLALEFR